MQIECMNYGVLLYILEGNDKNNKLYRWDTY